MERPQKRHKQVALEVAFSPKRHANFEMEGLPRDRSSKSLIFAIKCQMSKVFKSLRGVKF